VTVRELLQFMRAQRLAVEASVSPAGAAQAAVIGIAVTDQFEIVFDTLSSTRKVQNIRRNPRVALVIGGLMPGDERTVQYEGLADEPLGSDRERIKLAYFEEWPDGRERESWTGLTYIRVRPQWIRYSDFNSDPPKMVEFDAKQLSENGKR
jgi:general stress protein 26